MQKILNINLKNKKVRIYSWLSFILSSSQLCYKCLYQNSDMKNLQIRKPICPKCNVIHERVINVVKKYITIRNKINEIKL